MAEGMERVYELRVFDSASVRLCDGEIQLTEAPPDVYCSVDIGIMRVGVKNTALNKERGAENVVATFKSVSFSLTSIELQGNAKCLISDATTFDKVGSLSVLCSGKSAVTVDPSAEGLFKRVASVSVIGNAMFIDNANKFVVEMLKTSTSGRGTLVGMKATNQLGITAGCSSVCVVAASIKCTVTMERKSAFAHTHVTQVKSDCIAEVKKGALDEIRRHAEDSAHRKRAFRQREDSGKDGSPPGKKMRPNE